MGWTRTTGRPGARRTAGTSASVYPSPVTTHQSNALVHESVRHWQVVTSGPASLLAARLGRLKTYAPEFDPNAHVELDEGLGTFCGRIDSDVAIELIRTGQLVLFIPPDEREHARRDRLGFSDGGADFSA
jgi:hypothetical protein